MTQGALGRVYPAGETIIQQGDVGDCMYVIQEGQAEVIEEKSGRDLRLAVLEGGDFFGEMALFEREARSATVRALGEVRILTIDKRTFLRRIQEDPTLAFRIVETMSRRIRGLDEKLGKAHAAAED